jgi:short-chain fatty acids transporter
MIARIGFAVSRVFERTAPDPFVLAVLLTALTAVLALVFGDFGPDTPAWLGLVDAWRGESGLWIFLKFAMQMCLVLVTGHALAASPPVRRAIAALANLPASGRPAAAMVALVAMLAGLINWGLGLIVGAILAREVARQLTRRGVPHHGPLLAAAGYTGLLVWHGGFSGSAPLTMTTASGAAAVLPPSAMELFADGVPLSETIVSPLNLLVTGGIVVLTASLFFFMAPRQGAGCAPMPVLTDADGDESCAPATHDRSLPEHLDRSRIIVGLLAAALVLGVARALADNGWWRFGLNEINAAMLAAGLILHGSARSYLNAAEDGARGCVGIMLQFPLYGGILGMLVASGLIERFANWISAAGPDTLPLLTAASAALVNLFVPSGGGQWGIQGPIALEAGAAAGVSPGRMIMAVAYGDQLTNMLQPFWALPLLAITGCKARDVVGFTAIAMLAAAAWIALCLLLF